MLVPAFHAKRGCRVEKFLNFRCVYRCVCVALLGWCCWYYLIYKVYFVIFGADRRYIWDRMEALRAHRWAYNQLVRDTQPASLYMAQNHIVQI
jgi:hypothetical protein